MRPPSMLGDPRKMLLHMHICIHIVYIHRHEQHIYIWENGDTSLGRAKTFAQRLARYADFCRVMSQKIQFGRHLNRQMYK